MKKLIIMILVIVMMMGMATIATANSSGFRSSGYAGIDVCNGYCVGEENCNNNVGFCRIRVDGKVFSVTGNGSEVVLSYDGNYDSTGGNRIRTFELSDGSTLFVRIRGNKIVDIGAANGTRIENPRDGELAESKTIWHTWECEVTRTIGSSNIGVNLYQVNRNHWARELPNLQSDDPVAFGILMTRNGNVNLAEVGGTVTIIERTERWGAYFYVDANGIRTNNMVEGTLRQIDPRIEEIVVNFDNASRRFFPYDAGTSILPLNTSHGDVNLSFMLSVRGNTTLLPTSWMTISAYGDTSTTGVSGQWFRVMSGHQGTH